ncbi:uncharacterized protein LOC134221439 [Armigeres subalbatus]|uniref:uncharacterized protein LOC134221439 n=1 Tax=Armigeres subalbatus TaxID=124917 RepID=UPI002ED399D0
MKLICGKSRVAPLKELNRVDNVGVSPAEMTIPRLELCAAVLLAEQLKTVREALELDFQRIVLRSDSKIVLCWLEKPSSTLPVFVRNRVMKILDLTPDVEWKHVGTKDNPADLVSRGVQPRELMRSELWWNGPGLLDGADEEVDTGYLEGGDECDYVLSVSEEIAAVATQDRRLYDVIQGRSDYRKTQRIFGYVTRFIHNCKVKRLGVDRRSGSLLGVDFRDSLLAMVRIVQNVVFDAEIKNIERGKLVKGKLRNLNPIFDKGERLLRVGGRIRHSDLPRDQKHPIILPEKNFFTDLVIETIHREQLHIGLNGLLAKVRQQFWPVNAKRTINRVLGKCVKCFRANPRDVVQYMGDLPSVRVTAAEPFLRTGVDYAGPFFLKEGRFKAPRKAFICVFVCMCTKAIHLELVGNLSADGFVSALHRFVSRRGNVAELRSDNGTNFVGANRKLTELRKLLVSQALDNKVTEFCQSRGITWKFIPPRAPHQGGLWEAGVKSVKNHLSKVLNESHLTYEEMCTLLHQIEAILNSRPMVPQSDDPMDYQALSPGHFLVGRELTAIAEPFYDNVRESTLSRYQVIQRRKQAFWRRWSAEYVTELQKRGKWYKDPTLLREGLLVMLKEENLPPLTWKIGRIVETHPGNDDIVPVVTVRTSSEVYKRAATKFAVLPIDQGNDNQFFHYGF